MNRSYENWLAVTEPEIEEVLDLHSGDLIPANEAIGSDYSKVIQLRMELRTAIERHSPVYACPLCGIPVYLVCRKEARRFFFRHELEDGRCPARTKGMLNEDEINARKYNGAKESWAHARMKEIIADSLASDSRFSEIAIEKVWKGADRGKWRKPDVQATFDGMRVAFEVQLSTTFLRVIAQRREFYLREGGLLLWIFRTFREEDAKLTQDDVFYNNNRNVFVASEETLRISRDTRSFTLECLWSTPSPQIEKPEPMASRMVSFGELKFDQQRQRAFFFDYEQEADRASEAVLRRDFESFWTAHPTYNNYDEIVWSDLRGRFRERGISLPRNPADGNGPMYVLNALYSAKYGKPVGWRFRKLIEVAHRICDGHKSVLRPFRLALLAYKRADQIRAEDSSGKWQRKVEQYRPILLQGSPEYASDQRFEGLIRFLFPEVGHVGEQAATKNTD